jgi:branched-chain amino acid transport system ATP-binding protein
LLVWNTGTAMARGHPDEVFKDERVLKNVVGVA